MRDIDFGNLTSKDLIDHAALSEAFKKYLIEVLGYDEGEANFVISADFENPYDTSYITQDYEGEYAVDGKDYEVRSCQTDFCAVGLWNLAELSPFEFYMFFDLETMPDTTIGSYRKAKKLYLI
jgi:hypothetical protein